MGVKGKGGLKDDPWVFDLNSCVLEKLSMDFTLQEIHSGPPAPRYTHFRAWGVRGCLRGDSVPSTRQSLLQLSGAPTTPGLGGGSLDMCHLLPLPGPASLSKPLCTECSAPGTVLLCSEMSSPHPLNSQHLLNACRGARRRWKHFTRINALNYRRGAVGAAGSRPIHPPALSLLEHSLPTSSPAASASCRLVSLTLHCHSGIPYLCSL